MNNHATPRAPATPAPSVIAALRDELMHHAPFSQMSEPHVDQFIAEATEAYFAPGETVLAPGGAAVSQVFMLRRGGVSGEPGAGEAAGAFHVEPGELFPIGAVLEGRAVTTTYTARADTFCLLVTAEAFARLAEDSAPLAAFLRQRHLRYLRLSRQALQAAYASQALTEQSMETALGALVRTPVVGTAPQTTLQQALATMQARGIGSMLVLDDAGSALGILTRHDVLGRVALPQRPLSTPIAAVMSQPVHTLGAEATALDAALLMSRHGIRHVPVTQGGRVVGMVSERDLFAMHRLSPKQLSSAIRAAPDVRTLQVQAQGIRRFARNLLAQGVGARQLTELISQLNDLLTDRLVQLLAAEHGADLTRACWLAFGSEGRSEQTIATDQDNGLVFASDQPARDRVAWLAFARRVNEALDACGYPLCRGNVMASNPDCCLTSDEWCERYHHWMERGEPEDLLKASIFFDARAIAGRHELARPLAELMQAVAPTLPRFIRQMAENALRTRAPLNWLGAVDTRRIGAREVLDLKLRGTALFVDAARLYALAHGIAATNTRERLEAAADRMAVPAHESEAWVRGFEFLQMLRLDVQMDRGAREAVDSPQAQNLIDVAALNTVDRRVLKEALGMARRLQQRIELDYYR